jgi:CRISPR type IV-associated protein Csf2
VTTAYASPYTSVEMRALVTALTPIAHFGESLGNNYSAFRTETFVQPDGSEATVPTISGNAIRGIWRRAAIRFALNVLSQARGHDIELLPPVFHLLFSGGSLTSSKERGVDLDKERELRRLFPVLSVFGGAVGKRIMNGKLDCGRIVPLCRETRHVLPAEFRDDPHALTRSARHLLEDHQYTRQDASRTLDGEIFLTQAARELLQAPKGKTKALPDGKEITEAAKPGEAQQMIYRCEVMKAGQRLAHRLVLNHVTDLERAAFVSGIYHWLQEPRVGGKAGIDLGLVEYDVQGLHLRSPLAALPESGEIALRPGDAYVDYLRRNADEIVARMAALGAS